MFFGNYSLHTVFEAVAKNLQVALSCDPIERRYWVLTSEDLVCASFTGTIKMKGYDYDPDENYGELIGSGTYANVYMRGSDRAKKCFIEDGFFASESCSSTPDESDEPDEPELSALKEFIVFLAMHPHVCSKSYRLAINLDGFEYIRMTLPRLPGKIIDKGHELYLMSAKGSAENKTWLITLLYAFRSVCVELERLHGFGITHCDIHRRNIIGEGRDWHLIDFGLAKFTLESVNYDLWQLSEAFLEMLPADRLQAYNIFFDLRRLGLRKTIIRLDAEIGLLV